MKSNIFDPKRFGLLLRKEWRADHRTLLIIVALVITFLLLNALVYSDDPDNGPQWFNRIWYPVILYLGGFLFTSLSFHELVADAQRQFYLTLPASNLEKFASKWVVTAIFFPIAYTLLYQVVALGIGVAAKYYSGGYELEQLSLFGDFQRFHIRLFMVFQSVFLLGAVVFQRYSIVKTTFSLMIVGVGLLVFLYLCLRLVCPEYFNGFAMVEPGPQPKEGFDLWIEDTLWTAVQYAFYLLIWPTLLLIGYFKLKEKEV